MVVSSNLVASSTCVIVLVNALTPSMVDEAFKSFIKKYNKEYSSDEEFEERRHIFATTLEDITHINGSFNFTAEVNEFADMSSSEFADGMLCGQLSTTDGLGLQESFNMSNGKDVLMELPESVDWETAGAMGPTRDQRECGCCYAIQAATMVESRFKIKTGMDRVVPLSVQQLVDCSTIAGNKGCEGGQVVNCGVYLHTSGLVKEKEYPYVAKDGKCKQDIVDLKANQCIKKGDIEGWLPIPPMDELALRTAVAEGPVSVRIHASTSRFRNYRFGIITSNECGEGNMNHAVSVVGYGKSPEGLEYWKILNSWGPTWGDNGYGYIQRNDPMNLAGPCGIMREPDLYPVFRDDLPPGTCLE